MFRKQTVSPPGAIMPRLAEVLQNDGAVALVFGTETSGLANELATRCHHLIQIPTNPCWSPELLLKTTVATRSLPPGIFRSVTSVSVLPSVDI